MTRLIVFAGLPGSGKSTLARALAKEIGAVWLRVDSVEQAIRDSGIGSGTTGDAGYRALYAVAEDNLRLGRDVISDSVNPWMLTRNAWRDVGLRAGAHLVEIETVCTELAEHRCRIETRVNDIPGLIAPDWQAVTARDYHPWDRAHVMIDTAGRSVGECMELIRAVL
jgi:predicted kinase